MKKLLIALLLVPCLLQAQDFRHRYFHYDQWFDAPAPFKIFANTIDGADSNYITIGGGGATGATRGGRIALYGNEVGGAQGAIELYTGDQANSALKVSTSGAWRFTIPYLADVDDVDLVLGSVSTTAPIFTIRGQTADGDDDGKLQLTAGGSSTMSGGRGAYIQLEGEDVGGADKGGDVNIVGGVGNAGTAGNYPIVTIRNDTADASDWGYVQFTGGGSFATGGTRGSGIRLFGNEAVYPGLLEFTAGDVVGGDLRFITGNNYTQWSIPRQTAATAVALKFGADAANAVTASIMSARDTDGTDDDALCLSGGGAAIGSSVYHSMTRGASICLDGNEETNQGTLWLSSGDKSASSDIYLQTGTSAGDILFRSTASGNGQVLNVKGDGTGLIYGTGATYFYGSASNWSHIACEELTIAVGSGAAGVATAGNLCASGTILGLGARVTQAPGGGAATFDIGCTGSGNLDQFCSGVSTVLSTTCAYPGSGDGTNTPWVQKTATTMTVTTNANVTVSDMKVRICPYYFGTTAPTS